MPKYNNNMVITVVDKKHCNDGEYFAYNKEALGEALGKLNVAGIRAYLYFAHNSKGMEWTYNSTAYSNWLGMDRHSADSTFKKNGLESLMNYGYLREIGNTGEYEFSETPRQDWIDERENAKKSQVVTKKSQTMTEKSQMMTQDSEIVTQAKKTVELFNF